ncbi:DUF2306 domain-containing protein [Aquimonas sp.]|jgi:uncharacterized membrane protein|uniref:DUF2306 domain-containing protein n=1 Tax=Aquimonas sp. TaxID=1872588 RepID=UPI0037BF74A9
MSEIQMSPRGRHVVWALLSLLALATAAYTLIAYAWLPPAQLVDPAMAAVFEARYALLLSHIFGAGCALLIGPWLWLSGLRRRRPALHRWLGRVYLICGVAIGGSGGLLLALTAQGGVPARLGFFCLASAWLLSGVIAFVRVRAGDFVDHRRWMLRNYALSLAAVSLRVWMALSGLLGVEFEQAYPVAAWLCWLPNLWVAEWYLRRSAAVAAA